MKLPPSAARRYEVDTVLASGGFGHVLRARDRELDRTVAIKVLAAAALSDDEQVQRFREEGRVTASLEHPHVVRVLDQGLEGGVPWIVYELVSGGTLRAQLERGELTEGDALEAAWQVAAALDAAHARGILHRDVKPENVLVAAPRHWKLTDFGIARWAGREGVHTATGVVLGTPTYLAPDLMRGEPASPATDLYALGVMLFEMLAGTPPFEAESPLALLQQHLGSPPPLDRLRAPAPVVDLVARLLAKQAAGRPSSAASAMQVLKGGDRSAGRLPGDRRPSRAGQQTRPVSAAELAAPRGAAGGRGWPLVAAVVLTVVVGAIAFQGSRAPILPTISATPATPLAAASDLPTWLARLSLPGNDAAWDADARAFCRAVKKAADLPLLDELAALVKRRHGGLIVGRPPWAVELARARAPLDGTAELVDRVARQDETGTTARYAESQNRAWQCMVEVHARYGDGGAAVLSDRLRSLAISEYDHRRREALDDAKEKRVRRLANQPDAKAAGWPDARYWPTLALAALEAESDPSSWVHFAFVNRNIIDSLIDVETRPWCQPILDAWPALRACYPESTLMDSLEADLADAKGDTSGLRRALRRAGDRLPVDLAAPRLYLVERLGRAAFAFSEPLLLQDARKEFERLPVSARNAESVKNAEAQLKGFEAHPIKRKR